MSIIAEKHDRINMPFLTTDEVDQATVLVYRLGAGLYEDNIPVDDQTFDKVLLLACDALHALRYADRDRFTLNEKLRAKIFTLRAELLRLGGGAQR